MNSNKYAVSYNIKPCDVRTITSSEAQIVSSNNFRENILLQNVGTVKVYLTLDGTAPNVSTKNYHYILAADSLLEAGQGGTFYREDFHGEIRGVTSEGTSYVATVEGAID